MEAPPEAAPPKPKNAPMTTVDPSKKSAVAPNEKTFEANENSIAAAEKAATAQNPLPGQDGKERPGMDLEEHENSFARDGAQPRPTPQPSAPPQPKSTPEQTATPEPTPSPDSNELALLTQTPTPIPSPPETKENSEMPTPIPEPSETPAPPASTYRDFQQKTLIRGGINNRGRSAVNAVGTPQGRYKKLLEDAIGSRWYYYVEAKADLLSIGTTSVTFEIMADGSIKDLRITENTTTESTASIALRSIQETKFPPIPDDLLATIPDGHFTMEESFTIFANR
jgi:outer membrane biosynthesis protein TonB